MTSNGKFFWYDLMTPDVPGAIAFYKAVVGWNATPFGGNELGYHVLLAGQTGVGGAMPLPNAEQPPAWLGYIKTNDVDGAVHDAVHHGGQVLNAPMDIPGDVGRFAVLADPTGAAYVVMKPNGPDYPSMPPMTPGHIGWNEYIGDDAQKAFTYYAKLYGWTQGDGVDMGEMGIYQLVNHDGELHAGMMNRPPYIPVSHWGFYFAVEGIEAAKQRVLDNGGTITMEPMEVPGNQWVISAQDPQGAHFGLVSDTK